MPRRSSGHESNMRSSSLPRASQQELGPTAAQDVFPAPEPARGPRSCAPSGAHVRTDSGLRELRAGAGRWLIPGPGLPSAKRMECSATAGPRAPPGDVSGRARFDPEPITQRPGPSLDGRREEVCRDRAGDPSPRSFHRCIQHKQASPSGCGLPEGSSSRFRSSASRRSIVASRTDYSLGPVSGLSGGGIPGSGFGFGFGRCFGVGGASGIGGLGIDGSGI